MTTFFRSILISAGVFAAVLLPPVLHAQGFGGFAAFNIGGITEDESDTPTEITANSADIDLENMIITLIGNVVVDDTSTRITCNRMEIYLEEDAADTLVGTAERPEELSAKETEEQTAEQAGGDEDSAEDDDSGDDEDKKNIRKIICIGDVVCTKRADKDDPDGQDQIAISGNAEFDVLKDLIILTKAHSDPGSVVPQAVFEAMKKQIRGNIIAEHPMMMQGENWMVGESFTVFIKEDNRLKIRDMKFSYIGESLFAEEKRQKEEKDGKETESTSVTMVSTDEADIDLARNLITLSGNVDVDEESSRITCKKMVITLKEKVSEEKAGEETSGAGDKQDGMDANKDISTIVCTGDVVFRKRAEADDPDGEDQIAMSERADYDAASETILMTGKPVMMQGSNRMLGESIEILSREDNRMKVKTAKAYLAGRLLSPDEEDAPGLPTTMITAGTADIRPNEKITLSKNVVIDDGSGRITCGEMEVFLKKDVSSQFFTTGKQTKPDRADGQDDKDDRKNDVSKIVCSGDVVYRKLTDGQEQTVLSRTADYDAINEIIVMSGAHSNPQTVVSPETYREIVRAFGKDSAKPDASGSSFEQYSILMQGENWIAGNPITIHPKEGNRLKATDMKAGLRRPSGAKNESGGK